MRRSEKEKNAKLPTKYTPTSTSDCLYAKTKHISGNHVPATCINIDFEDADASSQQNIDSSSGSLKKLRSRSSWYGTWPRKSIASTKLDKESILAEKTTNDSLLKGKNHLEAVKSICTDRSPSMHFSKFREISEDVTCSSVDKKKAELSNSKSMDSDMEETRSLNYTPANCITGPAAFQQDSQRLEISSTNVNGSGGWLESFLSKPNSQLLGKNEPDPKDHPQGPISYEIGGLPSSEAPETSEKAQLIENSHVPTETPWSSIPSSWLGWFPAAKSSSVKPLPTQSPTNVIDLSQDLNTSYTLQAKLDPSENRKQKSGNSWTFWPIHSRLSYDVLDVDGANSKAPVIKNSPDIEDKTVNQEILDDQYDNRDESKKSQTPISQKQVTIKDQKVEEKFPPAVNPDKNALSNLLLPPLKSTFRVCEVPSTIEKITRFFNLGQQDSNRLFLSRDTPKIKKAIAIGVHGLFPAPFLRTVIGQPTGTSTRFMNYAAEAIRRWAKNRGIEDCNIEKIALEGGGKIAERVDNLWKLLLNWINHIQKADFILFACHSQGVPVTVMLVARLIEFGVVSNSRISICAMGVSLGPFIEFKSRFISGSAGELFEFADPDSKVSKKYERSLHTSLDFGVKVMFCASIDDQLVSMESAIFSTVNHPYIYRAVFIDGRIHAPDFLCHLVGFALKLRNIGVSDHGLIRQLSVPLAGSLYTGEGHSRLYDEIKVYDLAVQFALETTSVNDVSFQITTNEFPTTSNPYVLPWIMRGLLEEDCVKTELRHETMEILKMFNSWKPTSKILKDVKYRLEAIKSKL